MSALNTGTESDFTAALAQLLTNPALRETFLSNHDTAADMVNLLPTERPRFVSLLALQVNRQTQLLINRRMRAVFEQLPATVRFQGGVSAKYFTAYANGYRPHTYRRHSEDALHFCQFLRTRRLPYNQSEYNRVRFQCNRTRLRVCLAKDAMFNGKLHFALQIFFRVQGKLRERRIYFNYEINLSLQILKRRFPLV